MAYRKLKQPRIRLKKALMPSASSAKIPGMDRQMLSEDDGQGVDDADDQDPQAVSNVAPVVPLGQPVEVP